MKKSITKIHVSLEVKTKDDRVLRPKMTYPPAVIKGKKTWTNKKWFEYATKDLEDKIGKLTFISGEVDKEYEN